MSRGIAVSVKNLGRAFTFNDSVQQVFERVHAEFVPGEYTALLGPSGSGKSTFLNLIAGIDVSDAGEIRLDDFNISQADEHQRTLYRRHHIGFVFQAFNLVPTLTVAENVALPLFLGRCRDKKERFDRSSENARVADVLAAVDVEKLASRFPDTLSGGEQQRVSLARALVHRPGLILADEPTGNLDQENAERVLALLARLTREEGATLIIATHSDRAAAIANRVYQFRDRRLVEATGASTST